MHLNVLLFYYYFFLFVHAVIHSSTCLVTDQMKLSLKSGKNVCKCYWRLHLCPFHFRASLATSHFLQCLRHDRKPPAVSTVQS